MKNKLITTLLRSLLCVIGIYLLFIPIFYFYNFIYTSPIILPVSSIVRKKGSCKIKS